MIKYRYIVAVLLTLFFCSSCQGGSEVYVNIPEASKKIQGETIGTVVKNNETESAYEDNNNTSPISFWDDKPVSFANRDTTTDGKYLYSFNQERNYKVDLSTGRVSSVCQVPGCPHIRSAYGCLDFVNFQCPVATNKGIFYTDGRKVMLLGGEKSECVYENKYYTDLDKKILPDDPDSIHSLAVQNKKLYMIGTSFALCMDLESGDVSEPVDLSETTIYAFCANDGYWYYTDQYNEFFCYDPKERQIKKLYDDVTFCRAYEDRIFFIKYEAGIPILYSISGPDAAPEKVIEDCYVFCAITNGYVYYQHYAQADDYDIYMYDLGTHETDVVVLDHERYNEEGDRIPYNRNRKYVISYSSMIDHIFICDADQEVVFAIKAGETEYKAIELDLK